MRQTELHLTNKDRALIESYRAKGLHHAREVDRAHILSALDCGLPEAQIMGVLGVGRTAIWRTRSAVFGGGGSNTRCAMSRVRVNPESTIPMLRRRLPPWPARCRRKVPGAGRSNCRTGSTKQADIVATAARQLATPEKNCLKPWCKVMWCIGASDRGIPAANVRLARSLCSSVSPERACRLFGREEQATAQDSRPSCRSALPANRITSREFKEATKNLHAL